MALSPLWQMLQVVNALSPACLVLSAVLLAQVTESLSGGTLKDAVHNITFELDLEMMLDILKDIAAAVAYLHRQHPPISHHPLCSAKVIC